MNPAGEMPALYRKSYFFIPRKETAKPRFLQQNRQTDPENVIPHRYMKVEIGRQNVIIL
jgi:hypothetical protein